MKLLALSLCAAALLTAPTLAASDTDLTLFGKDPGKDTAFACYTRVYDASHLKAHPKQNVTRMSLLVDSYLDSSYAPDTRYYTLSIGVNFRKVKKPFEVSGSCSGATDTAGLLRCGVDCDGGQIDVRLKDANSILVDIPDGARVWDPSQPLDAEPDAGVTPESQFGVDDKTFLLARAALSAFGDDGPQADMCMIARERLAEGLDHLDVVAARRADRDAQRDRPHHVIGDAAGHREEGEHGGENHQRAARTPARPHGRSSLRLQRRPRHQIVFRHAPPQDRAPPGLGVKGRRHYRTRNYGGIRLEPRWW